MSIGRLQACGSSGGVLAQAQRLVGCCHCCVVGVVGIGCPCA